MILFRYTKKKFSTQHLATMGLEYFYKEERINDKLFNIKIWDTAGQEQYRALSKIFYKDADAAILVYDTTNKESYKDIKEYWLDQVKEYGGQNLSKNHIHVYIHIYI